MTYGEAIEKNLAAKWKELTCQSCGRKIGYIGVPEQVICICGGDPCPGANAEPALGLCLSHLEPEPCPTCAAYKAAGL